MNIAGYGIVSAIGMSKDEVLQSLLTGHHGIAPITYLETALKSSIPAGEIKKSNEDLKKMLGIASDTIITRTAMLGMLAAKEAWEQAGIPASDYRCGIVSATSVGGMDLTEHFYDDFYSDAESGNYELAKGHDCADSTERIADLLGIKDYVSTMSTACSSAANAIIHACKLIRHNMLDVVIAGGTDSITRFTMNGFNTLMILDKEHCKPFDARRVGLNMGEGAGYLVLVSDKVAEELHIKSIASVSGYGNANDAYHQTASSPEGQGAFISMTTAIEMSGVEPKEISYINVHGTGTSNNDLSEGIAMQRIFGNTPPPFSSTKPFTGHTLGAAAGIEAVISLLALQNNVIFPNLNFKEKIEELEICPETQLKENVPVSHVLSNSFGFGGNNSTLIFSKK